MDAIVDGDVDEVKRIVNTPGVDPNFLADMQVSVFNCKHFQTVSTQFSINLCLPVLCRVIGVIC
jgi:hypothetical protein